VCVMRSVLFVGWSTSVPAPRLSRVVPCRVALVAVAREGVDCLEAWQQGRKPRSRTSVTLLLQ
jgi:hypothetical protein